MVSLPAAPPQAGSTLRHALADVEALLRRYVVFANPHQLVAVVLWVAHAHALEAAETSPYLWVRSAEKRSGKSLLLDCLEYLVARPWRAVLPSEAVLFRKIEAGHPTLLLDEADTIFGPKTAASYEGLRAILNAGNRRGVRVPRVAGAGSKLKLVEFDTFCPKVIAGIGDLPDTVADRSIDIRLERRRRDEPVARFRRRTFEPLAAPVREALAAALADYVDAGALAGEPAVPETLNDRAADGWEPLLVIAEAAGGHWPARARAAALALSGERDLGDERLGVVLLHDVRRVFEMRHAEWLDTADLIAALKDDAEAPWADLGPHGLTPHRLASLLRPYGIAPRPRADGQARGYAGDAFEDAWARYLDGLSTSVATVKPSAPSVVEEREPDDLTVQAALPTIPWADPGGKPPPPCGFPRHRDTWHARPDGTLVCATCHPPFKAAMAADVAHPRHPQAEATHDERTTLLGQAAAHGWPRLDFAPGRSVSAGELAWGIFVSRASDFDVALARAAITAYERAREQRGGPTAGSATA